MITITEKAIQKLKEKIEINQSALGIKIGVKKMGCSGFGYVLDYATEELVDGLRFDNNGIKVWIDLKAKDYIGELTIDWVRVGLNEEFTFTNSLEKDRCGCGESFRV